MSTREELKRELLKLIESDAEFRYALMGLLGFREILDRITRIEERQQKLEERFAKLEERQQKLEERFAELEKRFIRLEERQQRLEERMLRVEEELREQRRTLHVIAHRFGVLTESSFREAMKYVVEEALKAGKVERIELWDEEGIVYGHRAKVEIDVVIKDNIHVLVEVKSRVDRSDVAELYRIGQLYEKLKGVKPVLVIISGYTEPRALETASSLGVRIMPAIKE